jgi:Domain of unknown function (DUF4432)
MKFEGREAVQIENDQIRVIVLREGGHLAEILQKASGVNPLWIPPWPSIEPSTYQAAQHPEYGNNAESQLLSGIMGHNLCLDAFGPPSPEEAAAGLSVHGESSVVPYQIDSDRTGLQATAELPLAGLRIRRTVRLTPGGDTIEISETLDNRSATDRPIAWTQHVTLGPPFLEHGATRIQIPAERSRTFEGDFGEVNLRPATDFVWPKAPRPSGEVIDLSLFTNEARSSNYTAHLLDRTSPEAYFSAYSPSSNVHLQYRWQRADFPWLGLWEENRQRLTPPWNGRTVALGLEFGVSPFPETRRAMVDRHALFGVPSYRWIPAQSRLEVRYQISIRLGGFDSVPARTRFEI